MTKEELEKEAREYADSQIGCGDGYYEWTDIKQAYLAGALPREKRIAELEEISTRLESYYQNQKVRIAELEAQIEKMKCCPTCDNNKVEHTPEEHYRCKTCRKFCNWELAD